MYDLTNSTLSPRRSLALIVLASASFLSCLQLLSPVAHNQGHGRLLSPRTRRKINLHAPYAPYKGPIEPPPHNRKQLEYTSDLESVVEGLENGEYPNSKTAQDRRQLFKYVVNRHGKVTCFLQKYADQTSSPRTWTFRTPSSPDILGPTSGWFCGRWR